MPLCSNSLQNRVFLFEQKITQGEYSVLFFIFAQRINYFPGSSVFIFSTQLRIVEVYRIAHRTLFIFIYMYALYCQRAQSICRVILFLSICSTNIETVMGNKESTNKKQAQYSFSSLSQEETDILYNSLSDRMGTSNVSQTITKELLQVSSIEIIIKSIKQSCFQFKDTQYCDMLYKNLHTNQEEELQMTSFFDFCICPPSLFTDSERKP